MQTEEENSAKTQTCRYNSGQVSNQKSSAGCCKYSGQVSNQKYSAGLTFARRIGKKPRPSNHWRQSSSTISAFRRIRNFTHKLRQKRTKVKVQCIDQPPFLQLGLDCGCWATQSLVPVGFCGYRTLARRKRKLVCAAGKLDISRHAKQRPGNNICD